MHIIPEVSTTHFSTRGVVKFGQEDAYTTFTTQGVKNESEYVYVSVERNEFVSFSHFARLFTNSKGHESMSRLFIIASGNRMTDGVLHFDFYSSGPVRQSVAASEEVS